MKTYLAAACAFLAAIPAVAQKKSMDIKPFEYSTTDAGFGLEDRVPVQLRPMAGSPNDQLDPDRTHGDVVLQICARGEDTCVHALRRLMRVSRSAMTLAWMKLV